MHDDSRLERAMQVFLDFQDRGAPATDAIAAHPELAELLSMLWADDAPAAGASASEAATTFGPFRLVREIGRGGMGVVFEAHQLSLGRRVALKVLGAGAATTTMQLARFRREALTLARLDHPNVVRVVDVGTTDGKHWLAMDLVEGRSLADHLDVLRGAGKDHGAEVRRLVEGIAQIAAALQHAHEAGVLHRDVKPSNILVHRDGRMLLSDFGLAHDDAAPSVTQAGTLVGTPNYMAPEQVVAARIGPAPDVFSLGATLYECVTLQRPFQGPSTEVVLRAILSHDPPDPRRLRRGLPADLAAIVLKAIEKDPARRYQTAGAMAADLRAFLDLQPVRARVPSWPQRLHRWLRREPLRAAAAALLLAATVFGGWVLAKQPELRAAEAARIDREVEGLLVRGTARSTSRQHELALADLHAALALRPHDAFAITCLAMALDRQGDPARGLAELDARAPHADDPETMQRARAYMLAELGRHDDARAVRATLPPPRTPQAFWIVGTEHLLRAQDNLVAARAALEHLSLAVRLAPSPRLVWTVQWTIAAHKADDVAAEAECRRTLLQHWPADPWALHFAALAMSRSAPAEALPMVLQARAAGMDMTESLMLEVFVNERLQDRTGVCAAVHRALERRWDNRNRQYLIEALDRNGDRAGFDQAASRWYREEPDNLMAMKVMGTALSWREDHDGAVALFQTIVQRVPGSAEHLYSLAVIQDSGDRREDAWRTLLRVVELEPSHARAHARLLGVLRELGEPEDVLAEHRRWAAARTTDPAASLTLAQALLAVEPPDAAGALAAATNANLRSNGTDPTILDCLARAHDLLQEPTAARLCRERAAALREAPSPAPAAANANTNARDDSHR
jgi:tetratricopeptide (TPR) repeat protein